MTAREFDPFRLDVAVFALESGQLEGAWPLADFERLTEASVTDAGVGTETSDCDDSVTWRIRGERRALRGGEAQTWLHLAASTCMRLECQRCLRPVEVPLAVDRSFLFVPGEDAAAQLDAQSEDDVLQLTRALDVRELIEDEILLAMPLVPRHDVCPVPVRLKDAEDTGDEKPNPFAALAQLKRDGPLN